MYRVCTQAQVISFQVSWNSTVKYSIVLTVLLVSRFIFCMHIMVHRNESGYKAREAVSGTTTFHCLQARQLQEKISIENWKCELFVTSRNGMVM